MGNEVKALAEEVNEKAGWLVHQHGMSLDERYVLATHNLSYTPQEAEVNVINENVHRNTNGIILGSSNAPYDVAFYGQLTSKKTPSIAQRIRKQGLVGLLGFKETVYVAGKTQETPIPLKDIVNTETKENAYFMQNFVHGNTINHTGRDCGFPSIVVVADGDLVSKMVEFLKDHPEQQYALVDAISDGSLDVERAKQSDKLMIANQWQVEKANPVGSHWSPRRPEQSFYDDYAEAVLDKNLGVENGK